MLLPAQHGAIEGDAMLLGGRLQQLELTAGAKFCQGCAITLRGIAGGIERKM